MVRRDLAPGAEETVVGSSGWRGSESETFFRPAISPDGRMLAYATRHLAETRLRVRDLTTGVDRDLGPAPRDLMTGAASLDLIPRYAFTPDGTALLTARPRRPNSRVRAGAPAAARPHARRRPH